MNADTRAEHRTLTDKTGYYIFTNLMPGKYEIAVEIPDSKGSFKSGVNVEAHSKVRIDARWNLKG